VPASRSSTGFQAHGKTPPETNLEATWKKSTHSGLKTMLPPKPAIPALSATETTGNTRNQ
jgi:hypothetical protein